MKKIKLNPNVKPYQSDSTPMDESLLARAALHPQMPTIDNFAEALKMSSYSGNQDDNYSILQAYTGIYGKVTGSLDKIIKQVDEMRNFYLISVILGQLTEDALTPQIGTDEIFEIKYPKDKKVEKALKKMEKDLNLDQLILDITPDLLAYGEYTLKTDYVKAKKVKDELNKKGKEYEVGGGGLKALRDTVEQGTVVSLTQDAELKGFLEMREDGKIVKSPSSNFVKFTLSGNRVRVRLEDQAPFYKSKSPKVQSILESLPRYIRVGRSEIYPFISKLKELELLEKLIPATKISKLSNVNLIGMQVPPRYDLEQGLNAAKHVEGLVNNKTGVDQRLGEVTVQSVLSLAGRTKVVPLFGDKGGLEKMDFKSDEPDDLLQSANDVRALILDSIGVPFELIYKSDGASKGDTLKRYARYLRKLKNIQRAIIDGVKQICLIHMESLGMGDKYDEDFLEVEFLNKLIEIDNLDKLEHADVTVSLLGNVKEFFNTLGAEDSPYSNAVKLEEVAKYMNRELRTIGLADALDEKAELGVKEDDAFGDGDDTGDDKKDNDGKDDGPDSDVFDGDKGDKKDNDGKGEDPDKEVS